MATREFSWCTWAPRNVARNPGIHPQRAGTNEKEFRVMLSVWAVFDYYSAGIVYTTNSRVERTTIAASRAFHVLHTFLFLSFAVASIAS